MEIVNMEKRDRYFVGEKIGPWPIFFLGSDELVAGRDNKHMDFRLSIMKVHDDSPSVVVSTLCMVHNKFGQYYLSLITPFHKFGLRRLMASALAAGQRSLVRPMDLGLKRIAFSSVVGVTGAAVAAGAGRERN